MTPSQRLKAQENYFLWTSMLHGEAGNMHKLPPREAPACERLQPEEQIPEFTAYVPPPGHKLVTDKGNRQMWECPEAEASVSYGCYYWTCGHCGKKYLDPHALDRHLSRHHPGEHIEAPPSPPKTPRTFGTFEVRGKTWTFVEALEEISEDNETFDYRIDHDTREVVIGPHRSRARREQIIIDAIPRVMREADDDDEGEEWKAGAA